MKLNLTTNSKEQEILKQYLEENASDVLAEKINDGVLIEKDGKKLLNKKTLDGFMKFAYEEAKKQATKGANCACIEDRVVFGWVIHYFEEESIIGTLYNEDGTEYKEARPAPKQSVKQEPVKTEPKKKTGQLSMFDLFDEPKEETETEEDDETIEETEEPEVTEETTDESEYEYEEPKETVKTISPIYEQYLLHQEKYQNAVIAMQIGDFYEIFGEAATEVSKKLDMTLTSRDFGLESRVQMIGFPYHKIDYYIKKITEFANLVIAEKDKAPTLYLKAKDGVLSVDTATGETKKAKEPLGDETNELIDIITAVLGEEIEIVR